MEEKIKVLRIVARLNIGGPALHAVLLTKFLNTRQFNSMLLVGSLGHNEGNMAYLAQEHGVAYLLIPQLQREISVFKDIIALAKIYRHICRFRPHILHTHTAKAGALGRIAGNLFNIAHPCRKIRLVHTFHGHIFEGYFSKIRTKFFILIESLLARFTNKVIAVSEATKKELVESGVAKFANIEVIPVGLDLEKFLQVGAKSTQAPLTIGIVGRLVPIKNHKLFLLSASKLLDLVKAECVPEVRFKIIGDGELKNELMDYCRSLGIEKFVDFSGWVKDLAGIYEQLDMVVLTSLNEGTPVSLIEAMASARPIVASDVGGVRDMLGVPLEASLNGVREFEILNRGILIDSFDPLIFARAFIFLAHDPQIRAVMGSNGRKFCVKYSKERLVNDIQGLYLRLVAGKNTV